jgi:hypothetical protein
VAGEDLCRVEAVFGLELDNVGGSEWGAMDGVFASRETPFSDHGADLDDAGSVLRFFGSLNGTAQSLQVVGIIYGLHMPAVGGVSLEDVFGEGEVGVAVDGDVVVIVEDDELPCERVKKWLS